MKKNLFIFVLLAASVHVQADEAAPAEQELVATATTLPPAIEEVIEAPPAIEEVIEAPQEEKTATEVIVETEVNTPFQPSQLPEATVPEPALVASPLAMTDTSIESTQQEVVEITGTQVDVAADEVTYYIKQEISAHNVEIEPEKLEKIIDQAETFIQNASHGPRNNLHVSASKIQEIKDGFKRYLDKKVSS